MSEVHCKYCIHWDEIYKVDGEPNEGYCKRYPPVLNTTAKHENPAYSWHGWVFPITEDLEWCGEHKSVKDKE